HTRFSRYWSSDVCSSDYNGRPPLFVGRLDLLFLVPACFAAMVAARPGWRDGGIGWTLLRGGVGCLGLRRGVAIIGRGGHGMGIRRLTDGAYFGPPVENGTAFGAVHLSPHGKQFLFQSGDFRLKLPNQMEDFLHIFAEDKAFPLVPVPRFIHKDAQTAIQSIDIFFFPPDPQV